MSVGLRFFVILTIALLLAILTVIFGRGSDSFVLCALAAVITSPFWVGAGKRTWRWFNRQDFFSPLLAYPLAYIAWFCLGSFDFIELPAGIGFGAFQSIPRTVQYCAAIGLTGYFCGVWLCISANRLGTRPRFRIAWQPRKFRAALAVLAVIIAAGYSYITAFIGLPILHLAALSEARPETEKIPLYHWIASPFWDAAYTMFLCLLISLWFGFGLTKRRIAILGLLILLLVFTSFGARAALVPPLLTALVMYHYLRRPIRIKSLAVLFIATFMALSAFGFIRDLSDPSGMSDVLEGAGLPRVTQPFVYVYFYFRYTVATLRDVMGIIPRQVPYQYGAITTLPLQTLLPGHHEMSDMYFKHLLGNEFVGQGQPATVLGPFYADFGSTGVFFGMFIWGFLLARLYQWMLKDRSVLSVMIFSWTMQAGLFGLFGGMFGYLDTLLIPLSWILLSKTISMPVMGHATANINRQRPSGLGPVLPDVPV